MNKLQIIINDPNHGATPEPREEDQFDNNYLYYMYCEGYSNGGESDFSKYDKAREYLHTHMQQIFLMCKRRDIMIPYESYEDCKTEMYMLVDDLYRQIFHDEKEYKIKDLDGGERRGTRFEKYYTPNQVYGYIKMVVKNRIFTYLDVYNKNKTEDNMLPVLDFAEDPSLVRDMEGVKSSIACDTLIKIILSKIIGISPAEKRSFVGVYLQNKSFEEMSRILEGHGINYSPYKVKKMARKVLKEIKENVSEEDLELIDFI